MTSSVVVGALCGLVLAAGIMLIVGFAARKRRPPLFQRVAPYVRDVLPLEPVRPTAAWAIFGPLVLRGADLVERILGASITIDRRLERLGTRQTREQFRTQQVLWGLGSFVGAVALSLALSARGSGNPMGLLLFCLASLVFGIVARDQKLSRDVNARERRLAEEFPAIAEMLALAVAAGEGPAAALARVAKISHGEMAGELDTVLGSMRTGTSLPDACTAWSSRTGVASIARFAEGLTVAVERGTPLVDVLHAQAGDARETMRRQLMEEGGRREIAMMLPVVFLILPVTVIFAFYPGLIGLQLTTG
ncbi:MAG: pilus assembly protein TadB [Nocardioidaceae bacterium]|nr:pilus assembly protein TadB [Nocardioidaceae bacterium]